VYSTFDADPLAPQVLYSEFGPASYRPVDIPKMSDWQRLVETSEGLLIGPHRGGAADNPAVMYLRAAGKPSWQPLPLPGKRCFFLQHEKGSTESFAVFCDSKRFATHDGAHTWAEKTIGKP
jgi:hypothetical protein